MYFRDVQDSALFTSVIFSILSNLRQYSLRFIQIMFSLSYSLQLWSVFYPHLFQWYSVFRSIYFNSVQYSAHLIQWCSVLCPIWFSIVQYSIPFTLVKFSFLSSFTSAMFSILTSFTLLIFKILFHLFQWFSLFCPICFSDSQYFLLICFRDIQYYLTFISIMFCILSNLL